MKKILCIVFFLMFTMTAYPGTVSLAWDPPTNNVDGSDLTDLSGYRVYYAPLVMYYNESPIYVVTNTVLSTGSVSKIWCTTNSISITIPSKVYIFWVTAVDGLGSESDKSLPLTYRVGTISTIQAIKKK